ncbi:MULTISPECIES: PspC domain-containing protein [Pseudoalteromonas]|uniref:PspC domain-containing protein n=1 Tax=Pseudoalteromonas rubra TaxID=43658 RepID=A0A5S3V1Y2_9GAMM|nr:MULTISPECIES: PspC domain-containing protein [Pseudoalteromonas]MCG7562581.1 PspC domain-containing protein [Pseudoalteromonas sp. McH1-42]MEC4089865.1 PspC domain-containing protein [Pseudoalteromonas rubra]QPB84701.1 PspC domain-containing protein [Pseudoalteromonas rubra]
MTEHDTYYNTTRSQPPRKKLGGVCSKLANRLDMPTWLVRLITVLLALKAPVLVAMAYFIAWIMLSERT